MKKERRSFDKEFKLETVELCYTGKPTEEVAGELGIAKVGGVIFIGATRVQKFRTFDKDTGKVLWEHQLPYGGYALPSTYMVNRKQYVIIPATGGGKLGTPSGDAYIAFALPDTLNR